MKGTSWKYDYNAKTFKIKEIDNLLFKQNNLNIYNEFETIGNYRQYNQTVESVNLITKVTLKESWFLRQITLVDTR